MKPVQPNKSAQLTEEKINNLTVEERKLYRMYGKLPDRKDLLGHKLMERKYFDSGDYELTRAGKEPLTIGSEHPSPDTIPHSNPIYQPGTSPVKESPLAETGNDTKEE